MIPMSHYLIVSSILFSISLAGIFLNRKNIITILMAIELMLLAVNTNFIAFVIFILDIQGFSEESLGVIALILLLLLIPINITTAIARCHDLGWSGWCYLLVFVPVVNIIFPIVLLALPSKK